MVLSNEIRKLIGELDQKVSEVKELIEDEFNDQDTEDDNIEDLLDKLDSIQYRITTIQENQGWI